MLTIEQLEACSVYIANARFWTRDELSERRADMAALVQAIDTEVHRRKRGPLTLAEAVASGRPFRRKAWGAAYWWDGITSSEIDGYDVPMFTKDGDIDLVLACEDLFATDYEIRPEEDQQ